jgi:hypothetical protein
VGFSGLENTETGRHKMHAYVCVYIRRHNMHTYTHTHTHTHVLLSFNNK